MSEAVEHYEGGVERDITLGNQRSQPPRRRPVAVRFREPAIPFPPPDGGSLFMEEQQRRLLLRRNEVEVGRGGVFETGEAGGDCFRGAGRAQVGGRRKTV